MKASRYLIFALLLLTALFSGGCERNPASTTTSEKSSAFFHLNFAGAKSTIVYRQGERDSTQLVAQILDTSDVGIPDLMVDFQIIHTDTSSLAPFVSLSATSATTDGNGEARIWIWNNENSNLNHPVSDSISASIRGMLIGRPHRTAGTRVRVQPLTAPRDIFVRWVNPSDTTIGNLGSRSLVVWIQDSSHVRLPHRPLIVKTNLGRILYDTLNASEGIDTLTWVSDGKSGWVKITIGCDFGDGSPIVWATVSFLCRRDLIIRSNKIFV